MAQELRYDRMVELALRGVVRAALAQAEESGLPGNHHFYVTFRTTHPGVELSDALRARYPAEMTIVLQFQYYGLEVEEERFSVTLSFNSVHERLVVPFAAITTFADPSVNFALQFQPLGHVEDEEVEPAPRRPTLKAVKPGEELETQAPAPRKQAPAARPAAHKADAARTDGDETPPPAEEPRGQVVTLDAFRKK